MLIFCCEHGLKNQDISSKYQITEVVDTRSTIDYWSGEI